MSERDKHGAIIDSQLLAMVYLELSGGREMRLGLTSGTNTSETETGFPRAAQRETPLILEASEAEAEEHRIFVEGLKGEPVWNKVWSRRQRH